MNIVDAINERVSTGECRRDVCHDYGLTVFQFLEMELEAPINNERRKPMTDGEIAQVLNQFFDDTSGDEIGLATFRYLVDRFADELAGTIPDFDREWFLRAAGAK